LNLYGIYDINCFYCCAGIFTLHQSLKFLNIKRREFYYALKEHRVTGYRYKIEFVGKKEEIDDEDSVNCC
jgi:hypothetical protein